MTHRTSDDLKAARPRGVMRGRGEAELAPGRSEDAEVMAEAVAQLGRRIDAATAFAVRRTPADDAFEVVATSPDLHHLLGRKSSTGAGLAADAIRAGWRGFSDDYRNWASRDPDPAWDFVTSLAVAPVVCVDEVRGLVALACRDRSIGSGDMEAVDDAAQRASLSLERAFYREDARRLRDELECLHEITLDMTGLLESKLVLNVIIDWAVKLTGAASSFIFLLQADGRHMEAVVGRGLYGDAIGYRLEPGMGLAGKVWQSGRHMVVNDYQHWPGRHPDPRWNPIRAIAGIPLKHQDRVIGVIGLMQTESGRTFHEADMQVLDKLAEMATLSLNNARLFEEIADLKGALTKTLEDTIQAVAYTVEVRDPYTAGHQRRVSILARAIARKLGLPAEQIKGIEMGAIIHDIGKLYVPSEFLSKPTQLAEVEFGVIKCHTTAGYEILKGISFPWPIAEVAHQHHEKMDGSGYPQGLRGDEIVLEARIVAVADVVEAISSHRPYRPSMGFAPAIKEITSKRGFQFDATVVDACLEVLREGVDMQSVRG